MIERTKNKNYKFKNIHKTVIVFTITVLILFISSINVFGAEVNTFDVNNDGSTTIVDVTYIQMYLADKTSNTNINTTAADVNGDGNINISDATYLQMYLVGVDISSNITVLPNKVTLNSTNLSLGVGDTYQIQIVETDGKNFDYKFLSSDENILTVDETGRAAALSTGTASIILQTENELNVECTINVKEAPKSVTLSETSHTLGVGESFVLSEKTNANSYAQNFTWESSNEKIAIISSTKSNKATITATGTGTATITFETYNGITETCKITVKPAPTSVSLTETSYTLGVGENITLAEYSNSGSYSAPTNWKTSNSKVATVIYNQSNKATVKATGTGTANITFTTFNGLTATCKVTVKKAPTSIWFSNNSPTFKVGQSQDISIHCASDEYAAPVYYQWSSSDTSVFTVTKGQNNHATINARKLGSAKLYFKIANGKTISCTVKVSGTVVKAIDVSTWQGEINFSAVKASGYDYVIIRAGYGRETYQKDDMFETNYTRAKNAGLKVGVYWYSYADSVSDAQKEAQACLSCLNGKTLDLPVYFDLEESFQLSYGKTTLTNMALTFCQTIENAGYKGGVYASSSWLDYYLDYNKIKNNYSTWRAKIDGDFSIVDDDIHQYTFTGKVNGISGNVDCNYIYNLNIV